MGRDTDGGNLQSVNRALRALELIAEAGQLGVTELGRRLGVHKATASRLVATLAERGMVERDPITEKFRLGFGLIRLAGAAMASMDLVRIARPMLEDLADRTRETVNLGVLSGDAVVYIDQVTGTRSIVAVSWVGRRTPLHCTSNGKVLLANVGEAERARLLAGPLTRETRSTVTDPATLESAAGGDPTPRLRHHDGGARGGPERGRRADPPGRRRGGRRAQRERARRSGCDPSTCRAWAGSRWRPPARSRAGSGTWSGGDRPRGERTWDAPASR